MTRGQFAETMLAYLSDADTEAAKVILIRQAFQQLMLAGSTEKAVEAYALLDENGGARLSAVVARFASLERRKGEARNLRASLKATPDNIALREKYGLCLAAMGDWKAALKEFA